MSAGAESWDTTAISFSRDGCDDAIHCLIFQILFTEQSSPAQPTFPGSVDLVSQTRNAEIHLPDKDPSSCVQVASRWGPLKESKGQGGEISSSLTPWAMWRLKRVQTLQSMRSW